MGDSFGAPVIGWFTALLQGDALNAALRAANLAPFADVQQSWTGVVLNWPTAAVLYRGTTFDAEITGARMEAHVFTIRYGVNGADPDRVMTDAMNYMAAIDGAIQGAVWLPQVTRVFVQQHDYGPMFGDKGRFAKFPEMHLIVEAFEQ